MIVADVKDTCEAERRTGSPSAATEYERWWRCEASGRNRSDAQHYLGGAGSLKIPQFGVHGNVSLNFGGTWATGKGVGVGW
jgi:hypothetical protein